MNPSRSGAPARGTGIASEKMLKSRTGAPKEGEMRERRTTVGGVHASAPSFSLYAAAPLGGRGYGARTLRARTRPPPSIRAGVPYRGSGLFVRNGA